jgi:fructose-1-phosphate kinase PfkB-like protein
MERLVPGGVHRLETPRDHASGKGLNLARVSRVLGVDSICLQFAGGSHGRAIVEELDHVGIQHCTVYTEGDTRVCTTLSEVDGQSTELIEPSQNLSTSEVENFFEQFASLWDAAECVALCGTAPRGFPWERLCVFHPGKRKLYLDAWVGVHGWLETSPALLKVNAEELGRLLGIDSGGEVVDVFVLAKQAMFRYPIQTLVVTQGSRRVLVFSGKRVLYLCPPRPSRFVNAIGAGDSFLAGWVSADTEGLSLEACLARGVAVSSVRCEVELPWELDLERVKIVEAEVIQRIGEIPWES